MSSARTAVDAYFAAINSDRFADLAAVFATDVEIVTTGAPPVIGREAALAHFPVVLAGYSSHDDAVTRWIEAGDTVVCEIAFSGTLTDGRAVTFDALDVFDTADGWVTRVGTWFDTRSVARQIKG
ncbi:nuclear transport factor 2 family protein [Pseudonocardia nantongensis]|uniref:nuclear transport factor 2 family protein n=1 Tax=Pseudonocardia nantongensis TaxID=1181885 RepID=UPI003978095B